MPLSAASHTRASIPAQAEEQEPGKALKSLQQAEIEQRKSQVLKVSF